ncbi:putative outer membrane starch-binding protein [Arcticibacter tournemirensis]|uniref:RagB/SusD family nutrient uptake outer membrane protein n=1 Tax=Arcticibacter tournemirensis TaxID=699437 RepID=A0A4Q0MGR1_9SPHI|nr:RagB/SusD family nutrient uptake outer membrane protein [Arcticibacter tournemirensis]KAA8483681.1 RagB/SusD family nutrient uptake outer membrane protein [Arcticibacter tournemirensis]RXF72453.1 RagB/SusD family nutrient uptake outer membrane protein [Arcticibacter tournemirensis]TQM51358.1 putative outer membrane starch-binding protein [Arcticibacter tournemirensis]
MKASRFIPALSLIIGMFLNSCTDELNQPSLGTLSPDIIANKKGVELLLIGAYAALDGQQGSDQSLGGGEAWQASPTGWVFGSVAGGDASKGSDGADQPAIDPIANFYSDANNAYFNSKWKALYEGVTRTNNVLSILAKATDVSDADRTRITAEARFLRGHYYFELKKMWNMVPWIDETTTVFNPPNNEDIWPKITADFDYSYKNLPPTQSQIGRANKWAAGAYLAKTLLYQHNYPDAKNLFTDIINNGVTSGGTKYNLTAEFEDNYRPSKENNAESVFAIQMASNVDPAGPSNANNGDMLNFPYGDSPFGCCGFFQPSIDLVNHYRTNEATGLPYLDTYNDHPVKNDMGVKGNTPFTPDEGTLDPRIDWTAARRGIPFLDWGIYPGEPWIRDQTYGGPYGPKKNIYWQESHEEDADLSSWAPGTSINYLVIRFADVLLMAAECEAQAGSLETAQTYVNRVRSRAADPVGWVYKYKNNAAPMEGFSNEPAANYFIRTYPAGTFTSGGKEFALKAIYYERKLELAMEGHRFFDLVRWGTAEKELNDYFNYQGKLTSDVRRGHFTKGKSEYYPVPQRQIDLSLSGGVPVLKQNPGYN